MSESKAVSTQADLEALKALQADIQGLERIEGLLDRYNVFEAIGFVGQEVVHSRFLAFLLDPKQNHGLGTLFLKGFLRRVSNSNEDTLLSRNLDNAADRSLDQTKVHTEVYTDDGRIDILLLNEARKWAVVIENKVWTSEHSDQLGRYHRFVESSYPGWRVQGLYLTPFGDTPSHEAYKPIGYAAVCDLLDDATDDRSVNPKPDVQVTVGHYTKTVRRHILGDPEIAALCQQMYRKHKRAFDRIYEHRPDFQSRVRSVVEGLIREHPRFELDRSRRNNHKFGVKDWDRPALLTSNKWSNHGRVLLFEFLNKPDSLDLQLIVGLGPEATRQRLFMIAHTNSETFLVPPNPNSTYLKIYCRNLLKPEAYEDLDEEEREEEIRNQWGAFLGEDLPRIGEALKNEVWIWESEEPEPPNTSSPT